MAWLTAPPVAGPSALLAARTMPVRAGASALVAVVGACHGCGACLLTCPTHALRPVPAAGECLEICPVDAITLREAA